MPSWLQIFSCQNLKIKKKTKTQEIKRQRKKCQTITKRINIEKVEISLTVCFLYKAAKQSTEFVPYSFSILTYFFISIQIFRKRNLDAGLSS